MDAAVIIAQAFWLILPAYMANASAVLVGGGRPLDCGRTWRDGNRILGDGKTWRGLLAGTFLGMTLGFGLATAASALVGTPYEVIGLTTFEGFPLMIPLIFAISFGALLGDLVESFFKRRMGIARGQDWIPFDQLDFILGSVLLAAFISWILYAAGLSARFWFADTVTAWHLLVLLVATPFIHITANVLWRRGKASRAQH